MTMAPSASSPPKIGRWPRTGWTNRQPKAREPGRWDGRWRPGLWSSDSSLSPGNRNEALVLRRLASGGRLWRGRTAQRRCHAKPVGERGCALQPSPAHQLSPWLHTATHAGCWLLAGTVDTGTTAAICGAQNPPRKDAVPLFGSVDHALSSEPSPLLCSVSSPYRTIPSAILLLVWVCRPACSQHQSAVPKMEATTDRPSGGRDSGSIRGWRAPVQRQSSAQHAPPARNQRGGGGMTARSSRNLRRAAGRQAFSSRSQSHRNQE